MSSKAQSIVVNQSIQHTDARLSGLFLHKARWPTMLRNILAFLTINRRFKYLLDSVWQSAIVCQSMRKIFLVHSFFPPNWDFPAMYTACFVKFQTVGFDGSMYSPVMRAAEFSSQWAEVGERSDWSIFDTNSTSYFIGRYNWLMSSSDFCIGRLCRFVLSSDSLIVRSCFLVLGSNFCIMQLCRPVLSKKSLYRYFICW